MATFRYPPTPAASGGASEATLLQVEINTADTVTELQTLNAVDFATQTTLAAIDTKLAGTIAVSGPLTDAELRAVAVPVSAVSLPLPTGAATEATLTTLATEATVSTLATEATVATLATESTLINVQSNTALLTVVDFIDTTPLLNVSVTNIPASASLPVQVVASLAADVRRIQSVEDIGEFIGLYTGAASSETLFCVLPLGGGEVPVQITAGTRISLRNMKNAAITSDFIALNFLG